MENIVIVNFEVESEAYQAFTELKGNIVKDSYIISEAFLVRKQNGMFTTLDGIDSGIDSANDMLRGGLIGSLLGIVGGPVGMLLMGSYGAMVGGTMDLLDVQGNATLMEHVLQCVTDEKTVLIAMIQEAETAAFDANFQKFKAEVTRFDAAEIAVEVAEAQIVQEELAMQAWKQLRQEKMNDFQKKVAERKAALAAQFAEVKADIEELKTL